ncbi:sigma factor-like helix-turn-helix DNA-binding protein [Kitasatospora sp. MBT63]|uniref:sigma factor-like helix-turn-helix DNA-binding protein n=1 Tax=Kitasatospora sp. MBT63 TaxID=1444768 RepID=UPI00053AACFD|nr:sigma factor-like helix-turn-helix DNA-binding protein [Kitasatospora sp. MBT63]
MAKEGPTSGAGQGRQGAGALSERVRQDIERVEDVRREAGRRPDPAKRPLTQHLASELFGYAYKRLRAKMRTGEIAGLVKQKNSMVPLVLTDEDQDGLDRNPAYRDELAVRTIAEAWTRFYKRAVLGGQWNPHELPDGNRAPAALETYFFGMCLLQFPRTYMTWRAEQEDKFLAHTKGLTAEELEQALGYRSEQATEMVTELCEQVLGMVTTAKPRTRSVMTMAIEGYSQAEIAEHLGITVPMVEGILYRFRQSVRSKVWEGRLRLPRDLQTLVLRQKRRAAA